MRWSLILIVAAVLQACGSQPVVPVADRTVTPRQAATAQQIPSDTPLQWGGIIIETRNLRETTEIQILAYPLDEEGRPETDTTSIGRFIAQLPGYLEPMEYTAGATATATGRLSGIREGKVANSDYPLPILDCDELALWPEREPRSKPRIHFRFGASSGGGGFGGIGISF